MNETNLLTEIAPQLVGPGGILLVLLVIGSKIYNFFTSEIERLNDRHDAQEQRIIELHRETLKTISANSAAITANTAALEKMSVQVSACVVGRRA